MGKTPSTTYVEMVGRAVHSAGDGCVLLSLSPLVGVPRTRRRSSQRSTEARSNKLSRIKIKKYLSVSRSSSVSFPLRLASDEGQRVEPAAWT